VAQRQRAPMRKAAATPVLALFRLFFLSGLPPLLGTRGARVTWETNCFSVGKRLKFRTVFAAHHFHRFHSDGIDLGDINTSHSVCASGTLRGQLKTGQRKLARD